MRGNKIEHNWGVNWQFCTIHHRNLISDTAIKTLTKHTHTDIYQCASSVFNFHSSDYSSLTFCHLSIHMDKHTHTVYQTPTRFSEALSWDKTTQMLIFLVSHIKRRWCISASHICLIKAQLTFMLHMMCLRTHTYYLLSLGRCCVVSRILFQMADFGNVWKGVKHSVYYTCTLHKLRFEN